jgi:hypothetical protein
MIQIFHACRNAFRNDWRTLAWYNKIINDGQTQTLGQVGMTGASPGPTIMNFNDQNRNCHAERSEASLGPSKETLRGVYPE